MKLKPLIAPLVLCVVCVISSPHVRATPVSLSIGDNRELGLISPNHPADPVSSQGYVDILLGMTPGTSTTIGPNQYTRTANDPLAGTYPAAVFNVDLGAVTNINLGSGYQYLLAKYDGPNWGSEVWYVGGLTGNITIPEFGSGNKYGVSHVFLFNGSGGSAVPDGGSTFAMLGAALAGLAVFRRKLGAI